MEDNLYFHSKNSMKMNVKKYSLVLSGKELNRLLPWYCLPIVLNWYSTQLLTLRTLKYFLSTAHCQLLSFEFDLVGYSANQFKFKTQVSDNICSAHEMFVMGCKVRVWFFASACCIAAAITFYFK